MSSINWSSSINTILVDTNANTGCEQILVGMNDGTIGICDVKFDTLRKHVRLETSSLKVGKCNYPKYEVAQMWCLSSDRILVTSRKVNDTFDRKIHVKLDVRIISKNYSESEIDVNMDVEDLLSSCCEIMDRLIAITSKNGSSWDILTIVDSTTGAKLHETGGWDRTHGMSSVYTPSGFLVILGFCHGISVWTVDREVCEKVSVAKCQRAWSMAVLPTGEVLVGGFQIQMFQLDNDGGISIIKSFDNCNVVDFIFPIYGYWILTIDRGGANSGNLRIWNLLETSNPKIESNLSSLRSYFGPNYEDVCFLPSCRNIFIYKDNKLSWKYLELDLPKPDEVYEIRQISRLLSQAQRTAPKDNVRTTILLGDLPTEIHIKIILACTWNSTIPELHRKTIASAYFCKPTCL